MSGNNEASSGDLPPATRNLMMSVRVEAFAAIEFLVIAGVAAYVFLTPPAERSPFNVTCAGLKCYNFGRELYRAMDVRTDPCDDFYQYTCGGWEESHPDHEDQFRYLEDRVYLTANEKLREHMASLPPPNKPLSSTDKATLSYLACVEVQIRHIDVPWKITELLFQQGKGEDRTGGGSLLDPTIGRLATPQAALQLLVALALNLDIDVLFKIFMAPDPRSDSRRIVSVAHSESLLKWMRHRDQLTTPEATATCIRQFINILSTEYALRADLAAALVKMDVEVTTKMAAAAALSLGAGVYVTFAQVPSLEAPTVSPPVDTEGRRSSYQDIVQNITDSPDGRANSTNGTGEENPWLAAFNAALGDKGNLNADEPLFAADPRLFALTREVLERYPTRHVRYYAAFHVVRQLAPYTSYRLVDALFSPENQTAAMVYYADACAAAASRLTSFALASYVFQNLVPQPSIQAAYSQLDALKNRTASFASSWLAQPDQPWALQRLNTIKSLVAWPARLNGSSEAAVDQFLAQLPDFRGYYVEIYLDAVAAIRNHEKAQLLDRSNGSVENKIAREEDGPFPGLRPTVRFSPWYGSILVSPSAVLEPLFKNGSDPLSMGAFGHLAAHELWHAALGEMPLGVSPQSDLTMGEEQLKRHKCVADVYKHAGANKRDAEKGSSENVADIVGLQIAYSVYREGNSSGSSGGGGDGNATDINGLRSDQLFFLASCLKWCSATPDTLSKTTLGYTTPRLRCNVPLAMLDAGSGFAEVFGCKPESRMVKISAGSKCTTIAEQPMEPPREYNITG